MTLLQNYQYIDDLFKPFALKQLTILNRIVMAPMTRQQSINNIPGDNVARYYEKRALGGVGLIITEGAAVNHVVAHGYNNVPALYGEHALQAWAKIVKSVHAAGSLIFP